MRAIDKITPYRKWENVDTSHKTPKRSIKWKEGPYHKDNAIQEASTLSAFTTVNIMLVHEVIEAIDTTKYRVIELEIT